MRLCATIRCEPAIGAAIGRVEPVEAVPGSEFDTWVPAAGHADPDSAWTGEENAYDDNEETAALNEAVDYQHWLEIFPDAPMLCSAVRFRFIENQGDITLDGHISGGDWFSITSGVYDPDEWHEIVFLAGKIDKVQIESYDNGFGDLLVGEFQFGAVCEIGAAISAAPRLDAVIEMAQCD
jgi:hypothetical protein